MEGRSRKIVGGVKGWEERKIQKEMEEVQRFETRDEAGLLTWLAASSEHIYVHFSVLLFAGVRERTQTE